MSASTGRWTERERCLEETGAVVWLGRTGVDQIVPEMEIDPEVRRVLHLRMHQHFGTVIGSRLRDSDEPEGRRRLWGFRHFFPQPMQSLHVLAENCLANLPSERIVIDGQHQLREVSCARMRLVPPRGGPVVKRCGNRRQDAGRLSKSGARCGSRRVL